MPDTQFDPKAYVASKGWNSGPKTAVADGNFDPKAYVAAKGWGNDDSVDGAAAIQGFGNMASAGYLPELTGLAHNPKGDLARVAYSIEGRDPNKVDADLESKGFKIIQGQDSYQSMRDESRGKQKQMAEQSPLSYYGGGILGAVASAPAFGAALKSAGIAKGVAPLASGAGFLAKAGNLGARALQAGKEGAALGFLSNPNTNPGDEGINLGARSLNSVTSGLLSAAVPPTIEAVKGVGKAALNTGRWLGTKALSLVGGVNQNIIKEYASFSDRINKAPSVDALKEISDDFVGKLASDVEQKSITASEAKSALKAYADELKDSYRASGLDANEALISARQTLRDAHDSRIKQLAGDIYDILNGLKGEVQRKSADALDTLASSNKRIDLSPVMADIDQTVIKLKQAGTDESLAVADRLLSYKERLAAFKSTRQIGFQPSGKIEVISPPKFENSPESLRAAGKPVPARFINGSTEDQWIKSGLLGKEVAPAVEVQPIGPRFGEAAEIEAPQAKKLIQGLDQTTEYSPLAGSFDKAKNSAFKGVRSSLDRSLKDAVPEYSEKMKGVAADAGLLSSVADFGDREAGAGLLRRLDSPVVSDRRAALEALGKKYGVDFVNAAMPESLPEYGLVTKAESRVDALRPDRVAKKIEERVAGSRQRVAADSALLGLDAAQQKLAPFKSLAPNASGQTQAQQKLLTLAKGKNIELEKMFTELGKLTDTDFVQAMKDRRILDAFERGATNGSRRTLMGSVVGFALGGVAGASTGASAGFAIDQFGPVMTKKILDAAIRVSKSPTVATISGLDLPEAMKRNIIIGLENHLAVDRPSIRPRLVAQKDADRIPAKEKKK